MAFKASAQSQNVGILLQGATFDVVPAKPLGQIQAGIILMSMSVDSSVNPANNVRQAIGFFAPGEQSHQSNFLLNGAAFSDTTGDTNRTHVGAYINPNTVRQFDYINTVIGVDVATFQISTGDSVAMEIGTILFSGAEEIAVGSAAVAQDTTLPVVLGFKPDIIFFNIGVAGLSASSFVSFGAGVRGAADAVTQGTYANSSRDAQATTRVMSGNAGNSVLIKESSVTDAAIKSVLSLDSFDATGFTVSNTGVAGGVGTINGRYLAIKLPAGQSADMQQLTAGIGAASFNPVYAGDTEIAVSIAQQMPSGNTGIPASTSWSVGAYDGTRQFSTGYYDANAVTTTRSKSFFHSDSSHVLFNYDTAALANRSDGVSLAAPSVDYNFTDATYLGRIYVIAIEAAGVTNGTVDGDQSLPAFGQDATLEIHWTIDADQSLPAFDQDSTLLEKSPGVNGQQSLPPFSQEASIADTSATPTVTGNQDLPAFVQDAVLQLPDSELNAAQDLPVFGQNGLIVDNVRSAAGTVQAWEYH